MGSGSRLRPESDTLGYLVPMKHMLWNDVEISQVREKEADEGAHFEVGKGGSLLYRLDATGEVLSAFAPGIWIRAW